MNACAFGLPLARIHDKTMHRPEKVEIAKIYRRLVCMETINRLVY